MYFFVITVFLWNIYLCRVAWKNWWNPPLAIEEPETHHLD